MSKKQVWMDIAIRLSKESKCVSHSVGTVLVKDNHIISSGVNGTPSGYTNCCDMFPMYDREVDREAHHKWSNIHESHSEKNSLKWVRYEDTKGAQCYVTVCPCIFCFKDLLEAGITEIYYAEEYDKNEYKEEMVALAKARNVIFERF